MVSPSPKLRSAAWRRWLTSPDVPALAALAAFLTLVTWNRLAFDAWLARFDIFTQILPWYAYLGERLRALDVPGWNPYLFSGTPFAGDPLSGWSYLPAMLAFALLPAIAAFKAMVALQLAVASLSMYAFARVLGMRSFAALVAAVVYFAGPFLQWNTYCCLQFAQFATWIPLALLGIELALRATRWPERLLPWCGTAFALSQMFGGWVGEGWIYAGLLMAGYTGYRTLVSPPVPGITLQERLLRAVATGLAAFGLGSALGAAGILPRLDVNPQTTLAGGDYAKLAEGGILNPPWDLATLLMRLTGEGFGQRGVALGGAVVVLSLLALPAAGRRFAAPFFALLTVIALILTLDTTPLHQLFYLIPRYQSLHEHDPWRVVAVTAIGPAILSGATVERLSAWRGRWRLIPLAFAPLLALAILALYVRAAQGFIGWAPLLTAAGAVLLIALVMALPWHADDRSATKWVPTVVPALLLLLVAMQPVGLELTGSWLGWPHQSSWDRHWRPDPAVGRALATEVSRTDPGGAGAFLQEQLASAGPFRYVGYGGTGNPDDPPRQRSYMDRRFEPTVQALMVNGRPIFLNVYEIQGYNPTQLVRYAEFFAAINGRPQNYHVAALLPSGTGSPLLRLLNLRYVVIDATLPTDREDVAALISGRDEAVQTDHVAVYQARSLPPHAWIVHEARVIAPGEALPLLASGSVDPFQTALVEGSAPPVAPPTASGDSARVTRYEPERLTIATRSSSPGVLIVSEIYAEGWTATIDGVPAEILPTHHVLRGIPLPAGEHTIELRYDPMSLRLGLALSGIAALLVIAACVGAFHARRGRPRSEI